jgi:hypothetical protein
MPNQPDAPDDTKESILSGPQVVRKFLDSLVSDTALDSPTVAAIHQLYRDNRLSHTNLLRKLEEERKGSKG